jgi:hypothetical protein
VVTVTSVALIAGAGAFGLFLIIFGIRGAVRIWRQERAE